ncbi:hypothetical protein BC829DRAFT_445522 [Chytridium lagenaria]|nr:hypothetical protein BC829DRAFT_445522 [Chytridium lagenaria]
MPILAIGIAAALKKIDTINRGPLASGVQSSIAGISDVYNKKDEVYMERIETRHTPLHNYYAVLEEKGDEEEKGDDEGPSFLADVEMIESQAPASGCGGWRHGVVLVSATGYTRLKLSMTGLPGEGRVQQKTGKRRLRFDDEGQVKKGGEKDVFYSHLKLPLMSTDPKSYKKGMKSRALFDPFDNPSSATKDFVNKLHRYGLEAAKVMRLGKFVLNCFAKVFIAAEDVLISEFPAQVLFVPKDILLPPPSISLDTCNYSQSFLASMFSTLRLNVPEDSLRCLHHIYQVILEDILQIPGGNRERHQQVELRNRIIFIIATIFFGLNQPMAVFTRDMDQTRLEIQDVIKITDVDVNVAEGLTKSHQTSIEMMGIALVIAAVIAVAKVTVDGESYCLNVDIAKDVWRPYGNFEGVRAIIRLLNHIFSQAARILKQAHSGRKGDGFRYVDPSVIKKQESTSSERFSLREQNYAQEGAFEGRNITLSRQDCIWGPDVSLSVAGRTIVLLPKLNKIDRHILYGLFNKSLELSIITPNTAVFPDSYKYWSVDIKKDKPPLELPSARETRAQKTQAIQAAPPPVLQSLKVTASESFNSKVLDLSSSLGSFLALGQGLMKYLNELEDYAGRSEPICQEDMSDG